MASSETEAPVPTAPHHCEDQARLHDAKGTRGPQPTTHPAYPHTPQATARDGAFTGRRLCRVHALPTGGGQAGTLRTAHATH